LWSWLCLVSCASVDQFGARINDNNLNSQDAMNRETLLNIVRASRYQSLNFIAVTQITGGQAETLTTGLPTITLGPAQAIAQHQFPFSNSLSSGVTGGFQSNPLVSSAFQEGMLSAISPKVLAMLIATHPRETVFYSVIDSIKVTIRDVAVLYRNDPQNDSPQDGNLTCRDEVRNIAYHAKPKTMITYFQNQQYCNYSKFALFLYTGLSYGLSAEIVSAAAASKPPAPKTVPGAAPAAASGAAPAAAPGAAPGAANSNATSTPQAVGQLCFDPALAISEFKPSVNTMKSICGGGKIFPSKNASNSFTFPAFGDTKISLTFRSTIGVFNYLGQILRNNLGDSVHYNTAETRALTRYPFLDIIQGGGVNCYVSVSYGGQFYCVPEGDDNTAMLLDILEQLRNLSITPNDLNSAFSVRLID
jgi:hypothetical protein